MPTEVQSPITRKGSKAGSNPPLGPGTNTNPDRGRTDSVPAQPTHTSRHSEEPKEED
jgi:hypothetical protein